MSSFSDDTKVVKGINSVEDLETLQLDLHSIYEWAEENNTEFNFPKFETLRYGNDDDIKESTFYKTKYNEKIVEHAKDLGIIMSSSGNFKQHIKTMADATQQLCGWILHTFSTIKKKIP